MIDYRGNLGSPFASSLHVLQPWIESSKIIRRRMQLRFGEGTIANCHCSFIANWVAKRHSKDARQTAQQVTQRVESSIVQSCHEKLCDTTSVMDRNEVRTDGEGYPVGRVQVSKQELERFAVRGG